MLAEETGYMTLKNNVKHLNHLIARLVITGLVGLRVANASCPDLLNHEFPKLQDDTPQNLCMYKNSVVLVVNTASFCGFTKQYESLENLYKKYKNKGLVVLGFPSGDFRNQEYSSNKEIAEFCKNTYGVKFPMFAKSNVIDTGDTLANPLFKKLSALAEPPRWNFHKYLISRDGDFHKSFSSFTSPTSKSVVREIELLLKSQR
jgi:glutathione peroxidase